MQRAHWISLGLTGVLVAWMASGALLVDEAEATVAARNTGASATAKAAMRVEVQRSQAQTVIREIALQGQAQALRSAEIAAETEGRVEKLVVAKGQRVVAGQLLASLHMDDRHARLLRAQVSLKQREVDERAVKKMFKQGLQAETVLMERRARLASAKADLAAIRLDIRRTEIRAPFDGVIEQRAMEVGEHVAVGQALFTLVDDSGLKINAQLPQRDAAEVIPEMPASIKLITGVELQGAVSFVATAADNDTRSYRVEVNVANPKRLRAAGMSAEMIIPVETLQGHFLSPGMLALGRDGSLGVKTVDESGLVAFHSVNIVRTNADGAWVTGLPVEVRVVTLGQGFVHAGDRVETTERAQPEKG